MHSTTFTATHRWGYVCLTICSRYVTLEKRQRAGKKKESKWPGTETAVANAAAAAVVFVLCINQSAAPKANASEIDPHAWDSTGALSYVWPWVTCSRVHALDWRIQRRRGYGLGDWLEAQRCWDQIRGIVGVCPSISLFISCISGSFHAFCTLLEVKIDNQISLRLLKWISPGLQLSWKK